MDVIVIVIANVVVVLGRVKTTVPIGEALFAMGPGLIGSPGTSTAITATAITTDVGMSDAAVQDAGTTSMVLFRAASPANEIKDADNLCSQLVQLSGDLTITLAAIRRYPKARNFRNAVRLLADAHPDIDDDLVAKTKIMPSRDAAINQTANLARFRVIQDCRALERTLVENDPARLARLDDDLDNITLPAAGLLRLLLPRNNATPLINQYYLEGTSGPRQWKLRTVIVAHQLGLLDDREFLAAGIVSKNPKHNNPNSQYKRQLKRACQQALDRWLQLNRRSEAAQALSDLHDSLLVSVGNSGQLAPSPLAVTHVVSSSDQPGVASTPSTSHRIMDDDDHDVLSAHDDDGDDHDVPSVHDDDIMSAAALNGRPPPYFDLRGPVAGSAAWSAWQQTLANCRATTSHTAASGAAAENSSISPSVLHEIAEVMTEYLMNKLWRCVDLNENEQCGKRVSVYFYHDRAW